MTIDSEVGDGPIDIIVHSRTYEAEGVISLVLRAPDGRHLPEWAPGAHIDLVLPSGLVRQYSLCGEVDDRSQYRIAVLRDPRSRGGSIEIHDSIATDQKLKIRGPRNHFPLLPGPEYLFVAGGIGITPMMPMIRHAERTGVPWTLAYGGRALASMAFLDEIAAYRGGTAQIVPEDKFGLLDLTQLLAATNPDAHVYSCGPEALLESLEERCAAASPVRTLHLERFGASPNVNLSHDGDTGFVVELRRSQRELAVPADRTLLEVVREVNPDLPFSCEEGYCGSCETRVLEGVPDHRDTLLTEQERNEGKSMMICVSRSKTPRLTLDL